MKPLDIFYLVTIIFSVIASIYVFYGLDKNETSEIDMLKNRIQTLEDEIIVLHTNNIETDNTISNLNNRLDLYLDKVDTTKLSFYKYLMAQYKCKAGMEYSETVMLVDDFVYQGNGVYSVGYYPLTGGEKQYEYTTKKYNIGDILCK